MTAMDAKNYTERLVRGTLVYSFVFAICLLLPYGSRTRTLTVSMNVLPAFLSAVMGLVGLGGGLRKRAVAIPLDTIMFLFYVGMFVPTILAIHKRYAQNDMVMLATYGTVPLLFNLTIHFYCVIRHLPLPGLVPTTTCPNCQHQHGVRYGFHFQQERSSHGASTIFTPDDDDTSSETALTRDFADSTTIRASSELDDGFVDMTPEQPARQIREAGEVRSEKSSERLV